MAHQTMLEAGLSGICSRVVFFGYFKQYQFETDMWGKVVVRNRFTRRYLKGYRGGRHYELTDYTGGYYVEDGYKPTLNPVKVKRELTKEEVLSIIRDYGISISEAKRRGLYQSASNADYDPSLDNETIWRLMGDDWALEV